MPLRALTLDMWGTILWPRDDDAKVARRLDLLDQTLRRLGYAVDREVIERHDARVLELAGHTRLAQESRPG